MNSLSSNATRIVADRAIPLLCADFRRAAADVRVFGRAERRRKFFEKLPASERIFAAVWLFHLPFLTESPLLKKTIFTDETLPFVYSNFISFASTPNIF